MAASLPTYVVAHPTAADWDRFVASHPAGSALQCSPWGALKERFGWAVQRIAISDSASGTLRAGGQLLLRRRFGLAAAYLPRGPLLSGDPSVDDALLAALSQAAKRARAIFLRLEPNISEQSSVGARFHSWAIGRGLRVAAPIQPRSTIQLTLDLPSSERFAAFSKGHRADIRRAERLGVTVRHGQLADLAAFNAIMQATASRANFAVHSADYYQQAWQLHQPNCHLLLAELDGAVVAAHMVFFAANSALYLYGGAIEAGLKAGANHLLQAHAIELAQQAGCQTYDFWGIPDALGRAAFSPHEAERAILETQAQADPLIGVYRFKKGFGGNVVRFVPAYDLVFLPPLYRYWLSRIQ